MAKKKDFADFDFGGDLGDISDLGGGGGINWDEIIGQQPENGSFVGPGGTDPNGLTGDDYNDLIGQAGDGLDENGGFKLPSMGGGSGGASLLQRLFGGGQGGDLMSLLIPGLASAFSGISSNHAINHARDDMLHGIDQANQSVQSAYDKSNGLFQPYISAGTNALAGLQGMHSDIASQFQPLGSGKSLKSLGKR